MTGRAPSSGRQKGFTLVELLVVMALLSLLMLGLASAMSTVSQTQERVDARLDRMDHQRVSIGFLRTVLGQRSEEHTSELQSPCNLVCRLLLEKKIREHAGRDAHHRHRLPSADTGSRPASASR